MFLILFNQNLFSLNTSNFFKQRNIQATNLEKNKQTNPFPSKKNTPLIEQKSLRNDFSQKRKWLLKLQENDPFIKDFIDIAQTIISPQKDVSLFALGSQATWIVKVIELISKLRYKKINCKYILFSKPFFYRIKQRDFFYYSESFAGYLPIKNLHSKQFNKYKKKLISIGFNPHLIIKRFNETGHKTVLLTSPEYDKLLASLLFILYTWVGNKEKIQALQKSLELYILVKDSCAFHTIYLVKENIETSLTRCPLKKSVMTELLRRSPFEITSIESQKIMNGIWSQKWQNLKKQKINAPEPFQKNLKTSS